MTMGSSLKLLVMLAIVSGPRSLLWCQTAPEIEWQFNYGGSLTDAAHSISATIDGGYIIAGRTDSNDGLITTHHGLRDLWVVKLRADGTLEWQQCYGGSDLEGNVTIIREKAEGGYLLGGTSNSMDGDVDCTEPPSPGIWLAKLGPEGQLEWQRCAGGSGTDVIADILVLSDGFMVLGSTYSTDFDGEGNHGFLDMLLIRLDLDGATLWSHCYGGSLSDSGRRLVPLSNGGYLLIGDTRSNDGDLTGINPYYVEPSVAITGWVVAVEETGGIVWQTCVGGYGNDFLSSVQEAPDGTLWAAGYTDSNDGDVTGNHGGSDAWVVKLDAEGGLLANVCLGGSGSDEFRDLRVHPSGIIVAVGRTNSIDGDVSDPLGGTDLWTVSLTGELEPLWQRTLGGTEYDDAEGVALAPDGGVVIAGGSLSMDGDLTGNNGETDLWVLKLEPWDDSGLEEELQTDALMLFPNPASDVLTVLIPASDVGSRWVIRDALGRLVQQGSASKERDEVVVSGLVAGSYRLTLFVDRGPISRHFVKR